MLSQTPLSPTSIPPMFGDAIERTFLGLELESFLALPALEASPQTLLALGRVDPYALARQFPLARRRLGFVDQPALWLPDPQLVVAHLALRDADLDRQAVIDQLWSAMPEGSLILVVDLHLVRYDGLRRSIEQALHLDLSDPLLQRLRRAFVPLHVSVQQHLAGMWSSFAFVGRKGCPARA